MNLNSPSDRFRVETGVEAGIRVLSLLLSKPGSDIFAFHRIESPYDRSYPIAVWRRGVFLPKYSMKPAVDALSNGARITLLIGWLLNVSFATRDS
jgi:hypothetical protein